LASRKKGYVYDVTTAISLNLLLEITAQFDDLAERYSEELLAERGVQADVKPQDDKNHDVSAICVSICSFIQRQGFSVSRGEFSCDFWMKKILTFCVRLL
jgi:hypothetical protein